MDKEKIYAWIWELLYETLIFTQKILNILHIQFMWISNIWSNNHNHILMIHSVPVENSYLWWLKTYIYILLPLLLCYLYFKIDWFEPHYYRISQKTKFEKYVQMEFTKIHVWFLFLATIGLMNRYAMTYWHIWDVYHSHQHVFLNHGKDEYLAWYEKVEEEYRDEQHMINLVYGIQQVHTYHSMFSGSGSNSPANMAFRHSPDDFMFNNVLQYGIHVWAFNASYWTRERLFNHADIAYFWYPWLQHAHMTSQHNAEFLMTSFFLYMREGAKPKWHWTLSDVVLERELDLHVSKFDFRHLYSSSVTDVIRNQLHYYSAEYKSKHDCFDPSYCWELFIETSKNGYIGSVVGYIYYASFRYHADCYLSWWWPFTTHVVFMQTRDAEEWYLFLFSTRFEHNNYGHNALLASPFRPVLDCALYDSRPFLIHRPLTTMEEACMWSL